MSKNHKQAITGNDSLQKKRERTIEINRIKNETSSIYTELFNSEEKKKKEKKNNRNKPN